jgi:hypothetical protein
VLAVAVVIDDDDDEGGGGGGGGSVAMARQTEAGNTSTEMSSGRVPSTVRH